MPASLLKAPLSKGPRNLHLSQSPQTSGHRLQTLNWGLGLDLPNLNPLQGFNFVTPVILSLVLEGLMTFNSSAQLAPLLAKEVVQPNPVTFVYTLQPGIRFQDGSLLRAADVVYALSQNMDSNLASQYSTFFSNIRTIKATKRDEVTITIEAPDATFKYTMAQAGAYVMPARYLQDAGSQIGSPSYPPMGTGPYFVAAYTPGGSVELRRNRYYWGPPVEIEDISIRIIPNDAERLLALKSGAIDGTFDLPYQDSAVWESMTTGGTFGTAAAFMTFNVTHRPWNGIHVRRPIAYSTNRKTLVRSFLHSAGAIAPTFIPPPFWPAVGAPQSEMHAFYRSLPQYEYGWEGRREEVGLSSAPKARAETVYVPSGRPRMVELGLTLVRAVKPLGIDIHLSEIPSEKWNESVHPWAGNYFLSSGLPGTR